MVAAQDVVVDDVDSGELGRGGVEYLQRRLKLTWDDPYERDAADVVVAVLPSDDEGYGVAVEMLIHDAGVDVYPLEVELVLWLPFAAWLVVVGTKFAAHTAAAAAAVVLLILNQDCHLLWQQLLHIAVAAVAVGDIVAVAPLLP